MSTFADLNDSTKVIDFLDKINDFLKSLARMDLSTVTNLEDGYYQINDGQFQVRMAGSWVNVNAKLSGLVDGELIATDSNGNIYATGKNISHFYDHSSFNSGVLGSAHIPSQADGSFYIVSNVNQAITKGHSTALSVDKQGPFRLPPVGGITNQVLKIGATGALIWANDMDTTYSIGDGGLSEKNFTTSLKTKLDNIAPNANNYSHPNTAGNYHIPSGGVLGQVLKNTGDGSVSWQNEVDTNTTYSVGDNGLTQKNFTTALKSKLDGIEENANDYSHPMYPQVVSNSPNHAVQADEVLLLTHVNITSDPHSTTATYSTVNLTLGHLGFTGSKYANYYVHPTTDGDRHLPIGGTDGQVLKTDGSGNYEWIDVSVSEFYIFADAPSNSNYLDSSGEIATRSVNEYTSSITRTNKFLFLNNINSSDNSNPYDPHLWAQNLDTKVWSKVSTSARRPNLLKSTDGKPIIWNNQVIAVSANPWSGNGKLDLINIDTLAVTNGVTFFSGGSANEASACLFGDIVYFAVSYGSGASGQTGKFIKYNLLNNTVSTIDLSSYWTSNLTGAIGPFFSLSKSAQANKMILITRTAATPWEQTLIEFDTSTDTAINHIQIKTLSTLLDGKVGRIHEYGGFHYIVSDSTVTENSGELTYFRIDSKVGFSSLIKLNARNLITDYISNTVSTIYTSSAVGIRNGLLPFFSIFSHSGNHEILFLDVNSNRTVSKLNAKNSNLFSNVDSNNRLVTNALSWGNDGELYIVFGLYDTGGTSNNQHRRNREKLMTWSFE